MVLGDAPVVVTVGMLDGVGLVLVLDPGVEVLATEPAEAVLVPVFSELLDARDAGCGETGEELVTGSAAAFNEGRSVMAKVATDAPSSRYVLSRRCDMFSPSDPKA